MAAAALGDYRLWWADVRPSSCCTAAPGCADDGGTDVNAVGDQYVFDTSVDLPISLRRVRTFADLLQAISGGSRKSAELLAFALLALLLGNLAYNLVAAGRWDCILGFSLASLASAVWELRAAEHAAAAALTCMLIATLCGGGVSIYWLVTVTLIVSFALVVLVLVTQVVKEDPRGHVLLLEEAGEATVLRNHCCMDVKLLVFDGEDVLRLVPRGGLLGGALVARGEAHEVGRSPPYVIKVYAPWERELGSWLLGSGSYGLRATVPPLVLPPSQLPQFTNCTEESVVICVCGPDHWTCSLWLPLAPLLARLATSGQLVPPGAEVPLSVRPPCVLRAFRAGPLRGLWSAAASLQSCCAVRPGERVEYYGAVHWTGAPTKVRRSTSFLGGGSQPSGSFLDKVH